MPVVCFRRHIYRTNNLPLPLSSNLPVLLPARRERAGIPIQPRHFPLDITLCIRGGSACRSGPVKAIYASTNVNSSVHYYSKFCVPQTPSSASRLHAPGHEKSLCLVLLWSEIVFAHHCLLDVIVKQDVPHFHVIAHANRLLFDLSGVWTIQPLYSRCVSQHNRVFFALTSFKVRGFCSSRRYCTL